MKDQRVHIIRCYPRRPPCPGGMEQHIAALSREQRKLGIRVTDVFNEGKNEGESLQLFPDRSLQRIRPALLRDFFFYAAAIKNLRKLRKEEGLKVVHVHGDWSAFLFARILKLTIGAKLLVASIHGRMRRPRLLALALAGVDLVFSTGKEVQNRIAKARYLPSAPAEIFFTKPESSPPTDVVLVGSLVRAKNYDLLLDVAEHLPEVRFAVLGAGQEETRLRRTATLRRIENIDWRGACAPHEIRDALAAAKLFLNLSLEEGTPTAAIEAMAVGVPVVLTPSNDFSQLLGGGRAGVVLDGWEVESVGVTLRGLLGDDKQRSLMGSRAREMATGERWNAKAKQVLSAIEDALALRAL